MVNSEDASKILNQHFKQMSLDEFNERHSKYVGEDDASLVPTNRGNETGAIVLYQRQAAPLQLDAYLASALTGLTQDQRHDLGALSHVIDSICKSLEIELYQPWTTTDPIDNPNVSPGDVFKRDRERVLNSDLVIHIADYASTGAGQELNFATEALIPMIIIARGDSKVSRMVTGIPAVKLHITYQDLEGFREELRERLIEIRPIMEERKLAFSDFNMNIVGTKVRILREDAGLTREEVAANAGDILTIEKIRQLERNVDRVSNPTLLELRTLATVLKTTVADLVEPDLNERMLALLQELMLGRVAARYGMSSSDQKKILRRMLLRVIYNLEED